MGVRDDRDAHGETVRALYDGGGAVWCATRSGMYGPTRIPGLPTEGANE
jgi:hypothetical protein